jgi:hypothetical protein
MGGSDITSPNTSVGLLTDGAESGRAYLSEYFGGLFKITSQILLGLIGCSCSCGLLAQMLARMARMIPAKIRMSHDLWRV